MPRIKGHLVGYGGCNSWILVVWVTREREGLFCKDGLSVVTLPVVLETCIIMDVTEYLLFLKLYRCLRMVAHYSVYVSPPLISCMHPTSSKTAYLVKERMILDA